MASSDVPSSTTAADSVADGVAALSVSASPPSGTKLARPLVVCGPSGAGKSTLVKRLCEKYPDAFGFSVSHTTRAPRSGEVDGTHYHFTTREEMEKEIAAGGFIETAEVHGNLYGTSREAVESVSKLGRICILDIDIQGVKTCQRIKLDVGKYVFISAPSIDALRSRLEARGTETAESLATRLRNAEGEIEASKADDVHFDARIINDDVDRAAAEMEDFVKPLLEESGLA